MAIPLRCLSLLIFLALPSTGCDTNNPDNKALAFEVAVNSPAESERRPAAPAPAPPASPSTAPLVAATDETAPPTPAANSAPAEAKLVVAQAPPAEGIPHPFARRIKMPPLPEGLTWLNTSGPLRLKDLRGKFVILDFWTYCCINCLHILPELDKLEKKYPNELVVIGVHSAKFETERDTENIKEAILRHNIRHPVINDAQHQLWNMFGVSSWPTLLMVDPAGEAVWLNAGETKFETIDGILQMAMPYYRQRGLLDDSPVHIDLLAHSVEPTPLRFPGKVLADESSNRLYITDSNHHRIVVTDLAGKLLEIIGSGAEGQNDGNYRQATFKQPQGLALHGETLYVADTENHLLRKVDLATKNVTTIAGTGEQGRYAWPGLEQLGPRDQPPERWVGPPRTTGLNSPWALWVHDEDLYIAMAGPHQIWKMPLDEREIGPYAGNGREDIVDGPLLPSLPYELGFSSFAQPSGLASDGTWLYVADSEGSSVRAVPFDPAGEVRTVVGTSHLRGNRLFTFGDQDGPKRKAQLQHVLGIAWHDGALYVADTYNNKIKVIDAETGETKTLAGKSEPGLVDGAADTSQFDEPAGVSYAAGRLYVADTNNHAIRVVEIATGNVATLEIAGLQPPVKPKSPSKPSFAGAPVIEVQPLAVKPENGRVTLRLNLTLPAGWKLNPLAPMGYVVETEAAEGPIFRDALGTFQRVAKPDPKLAIELPVTGEGKESIDVSLIYYYCQEGGEGICKVGSVVWRVPLTIASNAERDLGVLPLEIQP